MRVKARLDTLATKHVGSQATHTVQEKDAVEMVEFVLQADRFEALAFENARVTLQVHALNQDFAVATHTGRKIRNGQAALAPRYCTFHPDELRIEQNEQAVTRMLGGNVYDENPKVMSDLWSCHSHSRPRLHRIDEILGHLLNPGVTPIRGKAHLFQDRVWVQDDGLDPQG